MPNSQCLLADVALPGLQKSFFDVSPTAVAVGQTISALTGLRPIEESSRHDKLLETME